MNDDRVKVSCIIAQNIPGDKPPGKTEQPQNRIEKSGPNTLWISFPAVQEAEQILAEAENPEVTIPQEA